MSLTSPYAQAMVAYWSGDTGATYTIHRDDGFSHPVSVGASFSASVFNPLEQLAMNRCFGRVLDVGAGVGRHALFLQECGLSVTAIEIEPELVSIMSARRVAEPVTQNLFSVTDRRFDTILMLMNGFGVVGSPHGANAFFEHARRLLNPGGQILCDSLDVRQTRNPVHLAYQESNLSNGRPPGQMRFSIEYGGRHGELFDWLHVDFDALCDLARQHHCAAEKLAQEDSGHYLARLAYDNTRSA